MINAGFGKGTPSVTASLTAAVPALVGSFSTASAARDVSDRIDHSPESAADDSLDHVGVDRQAASNLALDFSRIRDTNKGALDLLSAGARSVHHIDSGREMTAVSLHVSSEWDTGMQAITELKLRTGHPAVPEMIRYIVSRQNSDGGWRDAVGDDVSGPTASLINHAALVSYYRYCLETGDANHFNLVEDALKKSWRYWIGEDPKEERLLEPLPKSKTRAAAPFGKMYYANVFPSFLTKFPFAVLPPASWVSKLMTRFGLMPQLQDFVYASVLSVAPRWSLGAKGYRDHLLETRGPGGLFCYLPMLTGLAVMALDRRSGSDPTTFSLIEQSIEASRALYARGAEGVRVAAYAPDAFYAIDFLMARLTADPSLAADPQILGLIDYVLASRATSGLFQQSYRSDEADDGLFFMTGKVLRLSRSLNKLCADYPPVLDQLPEFKERVERLNALSNELVDLLESGRNEDGGYAVFRKTDVGKASGAMKNTAYDSSTAVSTGFVLDGLAAAGRNTGNSEAVRCAVDWLKRDYKPGAGWWSRFGGGYLSGNATVIQALRAAGPEVMNDPVIREQVNEVVERLTRLQHPNGGWGEKARIADNPRADVADDYAIDHREHPALTAYAVMTLIAAGVSPTDHRVQGGVNYLLGYFRDPGDVIEKLRKGETVSFDDLDGAAWEGSYGVTTFSPPEYNWYVADRTLEDLHPVLALQMYLTALGESTV